MNYDVRNIYNYMMKTDHSSYIVLINLSLSFPGGIISDWFGNCWGEYGCLGLEEIPWISNGMSFGKSDMWAFQNATLGQLFSLHLSMFD